MHTENDCWSTDTEIIFVLKDDLGEFMKANRSEK